MQLYESLGRDVNLNTVSFIAKDNFFEVVKKKGYTKETVSKLAGISINTTYNLFKRIPIAVETAIAVCKALKIKFENAFERSKPDKGLSKKTIKNYHRLISAILAQAVYWQVISSNPAQRVKAPKVPRTEAKYLDEKQTAILIELIEKTSMQKRTMILLLIYSGLRRGELCGLEWNDIDFANKMITIRRSSQYVPSKGIFTKETKTVTSDRTIKLPTAAFELLAEYKNWQLCEKIKLGDAWQEHNRLFTQWDGKPISPDSITNWFREFIKGTDLPQITIHSLRHTNITLMIAAGVPLKTVSYRAGHAQTSTTSNIYSHAIRSADEMAAEVIDDILKPKSRREYGIRVT